MRHYEDDYLSVITNESDKEPHPAFLIWVLVQ